MGGSFWFGQNQMRPATNCAILDPVVYWIDFLTFSRLSFFPRSEVKGERMEERGGHSGTRTATSDCRLALSRRTGVGADVCAAEL